MIHIDIHDDANGKMLRFGTIEEFVDSFLEEVGSVTFILSTKQHNKRAKEGLIRVFQRKLDEAK